mgnify:CR=1 FL=1
MEMLWLNMSHFDVQRTIWRIQAVLDKGPGHLLNLSRWYAARVSQRARKAWSPSAVDEKSFLDQFTLPSIRKALLDNDIATAKKMIVRHFKNRTRPVFCFDPASMPAIVAWVEDETQRNTIAEANEICRHTFCFRGEPPVTFKGPVDWFYCPQGNLDWTWELNRHAFFVTLGRAYAYTGDERYVHEFCSLLLDWLDRNPVGVDSPNWASALEVAYRINTWVWAYYHFLAAPNFDDDALLACLHGLWIHGRYLAANLEYHVSNNHLLLESKALAMCGLLFPEFKDAADWLERGLSILWQQLRQQVSPDGVHREQATMYHRVITSELLEMLVLLDNNDVAVPPDIVDIFEHMINFECTITKPDGQIPLFGDSFLDDSYVRFSALTGGAALLNRTDLTGGFPDEATLWLVGPDRARWLNAQLNDPIPATSQAFPVGGYFVMRHGKGQGAAYLAFDCGPFGYRPASGHGHADALSFELYAGGQTLIADPGAYSYHLGEEWRNYFRGTAAHNTITVDGQDQSLLLGLWHVVRPSRATLHEWVTTEHFDFVDGSHDGYTRLRHPVTHRRKIFFVKPEYWIVLDLLEGRGEHQFDLYFHLTPEAQGSLEPLSGIAQIRYGDGTCLLIYQAKHTNSQAEVITGSLDPIQGWLSQRSGEKMLAPTLRYRQVTTAPTQFVTVLYPCSQTNKAILNVSPLAVADKRGVLEDTMVTGLKIEIGQYVDYFVTDHREKPASKVFEQYSTDGKLVYLRRSFSDSVPLKAVLHHGRELTLGDIPLVVRDDGGVTPAQ